MTLSRIWEPFRVGATPLRNRIFVSGHFTNFGSDHLMTDRHVAYHRERARGGVALIMTEAIRVHPTSLDRGGSLTGYAPQAVPAFRRVVDAVHQAGARIFMQLVHTGRHAAGVGRPLWAPSPIPWAPGVPIPHAMSHAEITEVVSSYALCARHAVEAGFDGLEVHLGHGHLPQQFLSPTSNVRDDEYGGSEENRLRFSLETLRAVREAVGDDFTMGVRISADEFQPGGLDIEAMERITRRILSLEPLAFVNVSQSHYRAGFTLATQIADMAFPAGAFLELPRRIKQAVPQVAVMAICRIEDLSLAESVLTDGTADMVGMTRAHIADPHLLRKAREGRLHEIRPCIYCNQGCIGQVEQNNPMSCLINPEVGREGEGEQGRATTPKAILVVGAGPSGLAAARAAALGGHHVEVWERSTEVGGQLNLTASLSGRCHFRRVRTYLEAELQRLGVRVVFGVDADLGRIETAAFDEVIIATGSRLPRLEVAGFPDTYSVEAVLKLDAEPGRHLVIVDTEGDWPGAALAEHMGRAGWRVSVVTPLGGLAPRVSLYSRMGLNTRVGELGIRVLPLRKVLRGRGRELVLADVLTGVEETLPMVDAVIGVSERIAASELHQSLLAGRIRCHVVGDAVAPRTALEAVSDGYWLGRSL